jgi:DNA segregation ATPase FtsK/SpoIIIE, S-DNA-T family
MTYSLNTLNNTQSSTEPTTSERFTQEIALVLGGLILVLWVLALVSYSSNDPAWSTTGLGSVTRNWGGRIGANVADLSY